MIAVADFEYRWAEGAQQARPRLSCPAPSDIIGGKAGLPVRRCSAQGIDQDVGLHSSIVGFPNATIITVRRRQPLDGLRPASQTAPPNPIHEGPRCGK